MTEFDGNLERGEIRIKECLEDVKCELAEYIAQLSDAFVKERGLFTIALSSASLIPLISKLCETPYNKTVDWSKWHIFWADQRLVPKNHAHSNYKLAKDGLFTKVPIVPSHVHSIKDSSIMSSLAQEAAEEYEFLLRQLVKSGIIDVSLTNDCPKIDLILLDLCFHGHLASLFSGDFDHHDNDDNENENVSEKWVMNFTGNDDDDDDERITFTLPLISSASNVAMVATGDTMAHAAHMALDDVAPEPGVARMLRPANDRLVWFLDKAAASKLLEASRISK